MRFGILSAIISLCLIVVIGIAVFVVNPRTNLQPEWNPFVPLEVSHPVSALTTWKLKRATEREDRCLAALPSGVSSLAPLVDRPGCGIDPRVRMSRVGAADVVPFETSCAVALRMAMWERHALQPAAARLMGTSVSEIGHFSSYSCRQIRTVGGNSERMSTHATGEAVDISGFTFGDGREVSLIRDWDGTGPEAAFLRAAMAGACRWFVTVLGPEFNALHRDHFHMQSKGWGTCR